ncbi:unnamed protein product [Trichobilharzia regenti]|nr:unnamed protein product [Trichobilharzia regenti]
MNDEISRNIPQSSSHSTQNIMSTKNSNPEMNTDDNNNSNNTVPKYQGRPLAIAEEWIQATEARYDSMENLLQSVRRDIDVLTERLNQTTPTSPELIRSSRTIRKDVMDNFKCMDDEPILLLTDKDEFMDIHIRSVRENVDFDNEEKLLDCDFVHQVADASTTTNDDNDINNNNNEEKYLQKTWRSPSDFSLHDPFYDKSFTDVNMHSRERGDAGDDEDEDDDEIIRYNFNSHDHQSVIETDLDDYKPEHHENSNTESESSSLSPAISPTFSNYVSDEVKLHNIIISNDDTITFPISANYSRNSSSNNSNNREEIEHNMHSNTNGNNVSLNSEDFQLYDNGHSLTTIDEASEENDDDWSSSEHDSPVNNNIHYTTTTTTTEQQQVLLKENNSKAYKSIPDYIRNNQLLTNQSTNEEFKLSSSNNANNNVEQHNITETGEYTDLDNTLKHKVNDNNNYSESFVFHAKDITISDSGLQTPELIILRRKKAGNSTVNSENCKKQQQRPLSADILHTITTTSTIASTSVSTTDTPIISNKNNKSLDKSDSGSLVSMLSTISQESVVSEVDSYVTVCSRLAGTGSEEAYTTAQSDSDGFIDRTLYADVQTDNDDCQTLSRKKPKTSTSSHYRNNKYKIELSHDDTDSQSASDIEKDVSGEGEEIGNVIVYESRKMTPISATVVTPKFTKLPTKLIAYSSEVNNNDDENDEDDKKGLSGEIFCHGDNNMTQNRKMDKKYEELSVIVHSKLVYL